MIRTFKSDDLADLWNGNRSKIHSRMHERIRRRLDALEQANVPEDMNVPGFKFHALRGHNPTRYAISVNGPWRITFEFRDGDAYRVDYEQYH